MNYLEKLFGFFAGWFRRPKMLMVCMGNTCRSPMAEAIGRTIFRKYQVESAGAAAHCGAPAAVNAVKVVAEYGADLSGHRARSLNDLALSDFDVIIVFAKQIRDYLEDDGMDVGKVVVLEISDPYGSDLNTYRKTAREIEEGLIKIMRERSNGHGA